MELRPITDDELEAWRLELHANFGLDPASDPRGAERFRALIGAERMFAAFDRGEIVATAATFDLDVSVPGGGLVPMAGLTTVTVRPTHRRRGLLRGLMELHLDDARRRGFGVSGLWASESTIYGRFGYGVAAWSDKLEVPTSGITIAGLGTPDDVDVVSDPSGAGIDSIYDAARRTRPGQPSRSPAWWTYRRFEDRPAQRGGASPQRHAVARRGGAPVGYVAYRQRLAFEHGVATGSVEIVELVAVDDVAEASLWRYLATIDLFPNLRWWNAPVDALVPWLASDPRHVRRDRTDALWLRIEDVDATLAARRYGADGTLRLEVEGAVHELTVADGVARASRTERAPDLRLDRASLGAVYLGGDAPSTLARIGRVRGEPAAIELADRMFRTSRAPWCAEQF